MFKKMISSLVVGSVLLVGVGNTDTKDVKDVELQKAINYAPIIKQEFKATSHYQVVNIKDNTDILPINDIKDSPDYLELDKNYIISFKNDTPIKIEEK